MPSRDLPGTIPRLRWWQYLGPWPLQPVVVTLFLWMSAAAYGVARLSATAVPLTVDMYPPVVIKALPAAAAAGVVLWLFRRLAPSMVRHPVVYWLAIGSAVVIFVLVRIAMGLLPTEGFETMRLAIVGGLSRTLFTVIVIQTIIGVTNYRLSTQMGLTTEALQRVRDQQEQMVEADERVRTQVSSLLHDRVQAGLIAACLELLDTADRADPQVRQEIAAIVHRLEQLRELDVRSAARTLSPDLADTDLQAALDTLGLQYSPAMLVTSHVDAELVAQASRPSPTLLLGCYRIIEQALLNAAVHGRARNCHVAVARIGEEVTVTVDDDGIGLSSDPVTTGLGSALTTTWTRILGGTWSRTSSTMGGVRLRAVLRPEVPHSQM